MCYTIRTMPPTPPTPPPEMLADWMGRHGLSAREVARRAGLSHPVVVRAKLGRRTLGWQAARAVEAVTGIPAPLWMDYQPVGRKRRNRKGRRRRRK